MSHWQFYQIGTFLIVSFLISTVCMAQDMPRGPQAGPPLSDSQRECLQGKMGSPDSGSRPDRSKMEATFKECGITPPSGRPTPLANKESSSPSENEKLKVDPIRVVTGLKSVRGKNNDYILLNGRVPYVCRDKVTVSMTCSAEDKVVFSINERTADGFLCLQNNQSKCSAEKTSDKDCISFETLSKDAKIKDQYVVKLDSNSADATCKSVKIASAKVTIQKNYYNPSAAKTEGHICVTCQQQNSQMAQLEAEVRDLKLAVERQQEMLSKGPDLPKRPPGREEGGGLLGRKRPSLDEGFDGDMPPLPARPQIYGGGGPMNRMPMAGGTNNIMGQSSYPGYSSMPSYGGYGGTNLQSMYNVNSMFNFLPFMQNSSYSTTSLYSPSYGGGAFNLMPMNSYFSRPSYTTNYSYPPNNRYSGYNSTGLYGGTSSFNPSYFRYSYTGYGR